MDLKIKEDGKILIPDLFLDKFDASKLVEVYLTQVEIDHPGNDVWEIIVPDKELLGRGE